MFAETENRIIFIDEISQFSKIDLELITRWANKNNILIVGLGDYKQIQLIFSMKMQEEI